MNQGNACFKIRNDKLIELTLENVMFNDVDLENALDCQTWKLFWEIEKENQFYQRLINFLKGKLCMRKKELYYELQKKLSSVPPQIEVEKNTCLRGCRKILFEQYSEIDIYIQSELNMKLKIAILEEVIEEYIFLREVPFLEVIRRVVSDLKEKEGLNLLLDSYYDELQNDPILVDQILEQVIISIYNKQMKDLNLDLNMFTITSLSICLDQMHYQELFQRIILNQIMNNGLMPKQQSFKDSFDNDEMHIYSLIVRSLIGEGVVMGIEEGKVGFEQALERVFSEIEKNILDENKI